MIPKSLASIVILALPLNFLLPRVKVPLVESAMPLWISPFLIFSIVALMSAITSPCSLTVVTVVSKVLPL